MQEALRPAMKAFILALLPGLDEEGSESFDKVHDGAFSLPSGFWLTSNVLSADRFSPRFPFHDGLASLLPSEPLAHSHLDALGTNNGALVLIAPDAEDGSGRRYKASLPVLWTSKIETIADTLRFQDIASIVGPDVGLMVRAFSSSLEDENNLVQRGTLDLLVTSLRLDGAASSKLVAYESIVRPARWPDLCSSPRHTREPDRVILMRSASAVVLRRDLSLSRRLYTWILGPDENPDHQVSYLCANALDLLRVSLLEDMRAVPSAFGEASEPQRPYRIFISLLDKYEIGYALTDVLVLDALGALEAAISSGDPDNVGRLSFFRPLHLSALLESSWHYRIYDHSSRRLG
jgi:hypothetical protein